MSSENKNNQGMKWDYPLGTGEPFHVEREERFEEEPRKPLKTPVRWRTIQAGLWMAAVVLLGTGYLIGATVHGTLARQSKDRAVAQVTAEFDETLKRLAAEQGKTPFQVITAECGQDLDGVWGCGAVEVRPEGRE